MKIIGKDALNINSIKRLVFDYDIVRVYKYDNIKSSNNNITNKLNDLNDIEQKNEILDVFLSGDSIDEIIKSININNKNYIRIKTRSGKMLDLRLENNLDNRLLLNKLISKYNIDRLNLLINCECSEYRIISNLNYRAYYILNTYNKNVGEYNAFVVSLLREDSELLSIVKTIIFKELISKGYDINSDTFSYLYNKNNKGYFNINNKVLVVDSKYQSIISEYMNEITREGNKAKKLQMKMEGF